MLHTSSKGVAEAALNCAYRTSTVSSCAFCEQEGHLATPAPLAAPPTGQLQALLLIITNRRPQSSRRTSTGHHHHLAAGERALQHHIAIPLHHATAQDAHHH